MEINLVQVLLSLLSGVIGGGIILAWIELQRHRHEKEEWKLKDKRIDIKVLSVESDVERWDPTKYRDEKEKLKIYEFGLNNKVSEWKFIIKIAYSNLTDRDIIITSADVEVPMPNYEVAKVTSDVKERFYPIKFTIYDLMKKNLIDENSFPLVLPQKSTTGIVFFGKWDFRYPYLVSTLPSSSNLIIKLDDGITRQIAIDFTNAGFISELGYSSSGNPHWYPAIAVSGVDLDKVDEEIPF